MFRVVTRERRRRLPSLRIIALTVDAHLLAGQLLVAFSYEPLDTFDTRCVFLLEEVELNWPSPAVPDEPEQPGTTPVRQATAQLSS